MGIFRFIAIWICVPIYKTIPKLYSIFYNIANARFFSGENATVLYNLSRNLYVLISVVMLFVFSATLLSAIVNPDVLTDKKKGVWALVKRAFFGIMMIVIIPFAFEEGYEVQKNILDNNVIEKVFVGISFNSTTTSGGNGGQVIAGSLLSSVLYPAEDSVTVNEPGIGEAYESMIRDEIDGENHNIATIAKNINIAPADENAGYEYAFEFEGLIALIAGGVMLYFLLLFAIDMAVRMFELAFFELTAPIAIVAYIATGEGTFKTWAKELGRVYLNVFIKIASISLYLFMIANLQSFLGLEQFNGVTWAALLKVIVIVGLFLFIHKLPDILGKFGINIKNRQGLKGRLQPTLNALGAAAGGIGTVGASTAGAWSRSWRKNDDLSGGKRFLRALGASAAGGIGGLLRTPGALQRGYKTGNLTAFGNAIARERATHPEGSTLGGRAINALRDTLGLGTTLDAMNYNIAKNNRIKLKGADGNERYYTDDEIKEVQSQDNKIKEHTQSAMDAAKKELERKDSKYLSETGNGRFTYVDPNGQGHDFNFSNFKEAEETIESLRESGPRRDNFYYKEVDSGKTRMVTDANGVTRVEKIMDKIKCSADEAGAQLDISSFMDAQKEHQNAINNFAKQIKSAKKQATEELLNMASKGENWSNLNVSGDNSNYSTANNDINIINQAMRNTQYATNMTERVEISSTNAYKALETLNTAAERASNEINQKIAEKEVNKSSSYSSEKYERATRNDQANKARKQDNKANYDRNANNIFK